MQESGHEKQIHLLLSERVQGVGLRFQTAEEAKILGLTGFVRNLPQGYLEILAQGSKANLDKLLAWLQGGHTFADIEEMQTQWQKISEIFPDFSIRY